MLYFAFIAVLGMYLIKTRSLIDAAIMIAVISALLADAYWTAGAFFLLLGRKEFAADLKRMWTDPNY